MRVALTVLAACVGLVACSVDEMPGPREGEALFNDNCAACHGVAAEGGELIGGQDAPDLTGISARNDGAFPRAAVLSRIDGYGKGNVPGEVMPEFGALLGGPTVPVDINGTLTPTPRPLAALLSYLESIQTP